MHVMYSDRDLVISTFTQVDSVRVAISSEFHIREPPSRILSSLKAEWSHTTETSSNRHIKIKHGHFSHCDIYKTCFSPP